MPALIPAIFVCSNAGCSLSVDGFMEFNEKLSSEGKVSIQFGPVVPEGWQKNDKGYICPICLENAERLKNDQNSSLIKTPNRLSLFHSAFYKCEGCGVFGAGRIEPGSRMNVVLPEGWAVHTSRIDPQTSPKLICFKCKEFGIEEPVIASKDRPSGLIVPG